MPERGYEITGWEDLNDARCRTSSSTVNASLSGTLLSAMLLSLAVDSCGVDPENAGEAVGSLASECVIGDSNILTK